MSTWPTHPDVPASVWHFNDGTRASTLRIVTHYDPPPIPVRDFDWSAVDDATYDGEGSKIGHGRTEAEAIAELMEKLEIYCRDKGAAVDPTMGACIECGAEQGVACRGPAS